jgi:hypothetical protein
MTKQKAALGSHADTFGSCRLDSIHEHSFSAMKLVGAPAFMRGKECFSTPGKVFPLGCFSSKLLQNRHPERSASRIYRVTQRLWRGVEEPVLSVAEGTSALLILPMLLGAFRPPKLAPAVQRASPGFDDPPPRVSRWAQTGGSPRIYAGKGVLQHSGKEVSELILRLSAGHTAAPLAGEHRQPPPPAPQLQKLTTCLQWKPYPHLCHSRKRSGSGRSYTQRRNGDHN